MNVSQSISNAPISFDHKEPPETTFSSHGKQSKDSRIIKLNPPSASSNSILELANAKERTVEGSPILSGSSWPWTDRSKLLHQFHGSSVTGSKKRTSSKVSPHLSTVGEPPPTKRADRRHRSRRNLQSLEAIVTDPSQDQSSKGPLFFSQQPVQRPSLPYRLSSSEIGTKMLSKANKEDIGGVRTLKLARGSMSVSSPSRPSGQRTPSGNVRGIQTHSNKSKSPESGEKSKALHNLDQAGILELLEQDERPTFILDLADQANFEPGPLNIIFANASLKAAGPLLNLINGRRKQESPGLNATTRFSEFKAWSTNHAKDHHSLDIALPSFFYAGLTWSNSSLRERFRVIKVNNASSQGYSGSFPPSMDVPSTSSQVSKERNSFMAQNEEPTKEEPQDYFGNASAALLDYGQQASVGIHETNNVMGKGSQRGSKAGTPTVQYNRPAGQGSWAGSAAGSPLGTQTTEAILQAARVGDLDHFQVLPQTESGFFDWTRLPNSPALPPHVQFAKSVDWASTPLGPIESWSAELRSMSNLIMASPYPAAMYWGPELVAMYNEAYITLAGQKHPQLMGQRYREAWAEIWDSIEEVFRDAATTGQATMKDDDCLFIQRALDEGQLEETYFSWSIIPLVGADGSVVGLYNPAFEKTRRKVAERRMLTLRECGEKTASAQDLKSFWQQCLRGLEYNEYDSPFVLLYSATDDSGSDTSSMHSNSHMGMKQYVLEGALGIPAGHPASASPIDLRNGTEYLAQVFREATKGDQPLLLSTNDGTLHGGLIEGIELRGFGDPCTAAVCCPVYLTSSDTPLGFLVMGINPRRPYDDDYSLYVQLLTRQLATTMASVVLFEEEIARGKRAARLAAQDRIALSEQLAIRTQEAVESETKFTRMAAFAPVGIFIADSQGRLSYTNDKWYEISEVPRGLAGTDQWMDFVMKEDQEVLRKLWSKLVDNGVALNAEFRFKREWFDQNGNRGDTWVLASAFPEKSEDGEVNVIFGSITDISQQKWAEYFEKRRMEEAVEMKRQQENFIDITSHEMRNPLSAILQCADEITTSLTDLQTNSVPQGVTGDLVKNAVEASGIIALCAQHQKRIVDDILTLSKLDSALLLVTPCDIMPISVVQQALKMFDGEVHSADIKLNFKVDNSMTKLDVAWVKLDPSRLLQVLINLTTNAIKFTTTQEKRVINVTMGASLERPAKEGNIVSYFPPRTKKKDLTKSSDWGVGEALYLHFSVQDTGRGLSDEEKKLLFLRFSQASPRTHVQYGGSGLGLFISRELVELQGGEIGVASKAGEGSTFAFYIKARRTTKPEDEINQFSATGTRKPTSGRQALPSNPKVPRQGFGSSQNKSPASPRRTGPKDALKVLIVEDNLVNQKVLGKQLRNMGCVVHVADHGVECLDRLKQSTFWKGNENEGLEISVILMDQEMPIMDGLTCTKEIRNLEKKGYVTSHVPIIAVTANARSEQIDTAMDVGMVCVSIHTWCMNHLLIKSP